MFNKKAQLKMSYHDYQVFQSKQLLAQLSPERKARLAEQIQTRIVLEGAQIKNPEVLSLVQRELNGGD